MRRIIFTVLILFVTVGLGAQKNEKTTIVLRSESIIKGELIDWQQDDYVIIKVKGIADPLVIKQENIKRNITVDQNYNVQLREEIKGLRSLSKSSKNNFKNEGLYSTLKGHFITANEGDRARGTNGFGISISAGHRFCRLLAVGGGFGYDQFIWDSGEEMIPLFAEVSGFINDAPTSLFYNLQAGYSIALFDDDFLIDNARGGIMIYPSIGLRFGQGDTKMTLDFGYKIQNATYTYADIWDSTTTREQKLTYKRMTLRIGVLLQ